MTLADPGAFRSKEHSWSNVTTDWLNEHRLRSLVGHCRTNLSNSAKSINQLATILTALLVYALVFLSSALSTADAQTVLTPRQDIVEGLKAQYGEIPVGRGLTKNGMMMEVFATPDGSTWTLVVTAPDMMSEIVSAGTAWISVRKPVGEGPF